jgi:hypothetical protein
MTQTQSMKVFLEQALAFAHAALEEPTPERIHRAQRQVAQVFPRLRWIDRCPLTLAEARQLVELVIELRAVLGAVARLESLES